MITSSLSIIIYLMKASLLREALVSLHVHCIVVLPQAVKWHETVARLES